MRKKIIIIYLVGVIVGWGLGFNHMKHFSKSINSQMTYGDVAFITALSLFSWADVTALGLIELAESDFWNKPIQ